MTQTSRRYLLDNVALRTGSTRQWFVSERYSIESNLLVESGDPSRGHYYHPFAHPEIVAEFARIEPGDVDRALGFAALRGLLTGAGVLHEDGSRGNHSLEFMWRHATQVRRTIAVIASLGEEDYGRLEGAILGRRSDADDSWDFDVIDTGGAVDCYSGSRAYIELESGTQRQWADLRPLANSVVLETINANIGSVRLKMRALQTREFGFIRDYDFDSLLAVIYAHLAGAAAGDHVYVRCAQCGNFFQREHGRQQYCPPRTDGAGKAESPCSNRARKARVKEKQELKANK